ncbi:DUF4249 domain-containing protein [Subsaximicrobium wynnwilliamsii]|uniref:DUF4249 domain-containing protein n=1 Tax=Subsaximicrobium wynnwilliamsii TaxID=291179 RepID=A0A5C6ZGD9_9FLAO|nr:DUF4249 family protein [Subsaximicrobium wynnwilliamsii]TXD83018.1 DUF4249 domain-containing protein [Subsaximicrobium wynnwilliamsii]TXD88762.1 DUF4249 domain-containing protein [Subsaximicrobium wynnwilliamsii]TXE02835.1 DUF4249 domain-containing protein [Subsaximicrobium wynnwilliamsii]
MKKYIAILLTLLFVSCEDVIDVDLNEAAPKLVIDASIDWYKDSMGLDQQIKLTLLTPFFNPEIAPATGAVVSITKDNNESFEFLEEGESGIYTNNTFITELNATYTLSILYDGDTYFATETLMPVVNIDYVEQNDEGGFSGEDIELKAFYTDPANEENYYFFEFITDIVEIPNLEVYEDRFTDGNQIFGFYSEEDLASGDIVTIRNHGISKRFYEYMFILLQQSSEGGGGPFETQPATVRGNCINQTNPDHFPLGYFRLSEVAELIYTVQ